MANTEKTPNAGKLAIAALISVAEESLLFIDIPPIPPMSEEQKADQARKFNQTIDRIVHDLCDPFNPFGL